MVVREVRTDPLGRPVVILADDESKRFLPIWIGPWEALCIAVRLQNSPVTRPLTHDLFTELLQRLGVTLERIVVSDFRNSTYFATLMLRDNGRLREIDARPSDAIALAVRTGAEVFATEPVLREAALEESAADESPEDNDTFRRLIAELDDDMEGA
jgi:bifunctional DNase/RNase